MIKKKEISRVWALLILFELENNPDNTITLTRKCLELKYYFEKQEVQVVIMYIRLESFFYILSYF